MTSEVFNMDCLEYMRTLPDKAFALAIADPPYGIGDKFKGGKTGKMNFNEVVDKGWDNVPDQIFFDELSRVCENVIIPTPPSWPRIRWWSWPVWSPATPAR